MATADIGECDEECNPRKIKDLKDFEELFVEDMVEDMKEELNSIKRFGRRLSSLLKNESENKSIKKLEERLSTTSYSTYEDAWEELPEPEPGEVMVDLKTGIQEATIALNLFLNNQFEEAKLRMEPLAKKSMYHALAYGTIMYLQAAMTLENNHLEKAVDVVRVSVEVCHKQRKRHSLTGNLGRSRKAQYYNNFTDEQAHAELCYAECLLERAFLMFVQDENLLAMFRGSLKIRDCYRSYKECWKILMHREWKDEKLKTDFESGVRMGIGSFNLMLSMLPSRLLKILEVVGFSGNKRFGLTQMNKSANLIGSLRSPLCSLMLLAYHTFITHMLGLDVDSNINRARQLLKPCLVDFPKGAMFLFFQGRIDLVGGNIPKAIDSYHASIDSQSEWKQMHHICYWELLWCHSYMGDWLLAMKYAEKLSYESRWSKATYLYQKASFLLQYAEECPDKVTPEMRKHIDGLFDAIPTMVQRIAGKSIPVEKFALRKTKRYNEQGRRLVLPALELMYIWNGFNIIGKSEPHLASMLQLIEKTINKLLEQKSELKFFHDDYCLAMLLKGICLKHLKKALQAEMCFREILDTHKSLKFDMYLLPWTEIELALVALDSDNLAEARKRIDKAKSYKGYSLESRLHFRMHAISLYIKARRRGERLDDFDERLENVEDLDALDNDADYSGNSQAETPVAADTNDNKHEFLMTNGGEFPRFDSTVS